MRKEHKTNFSKTTLNKAEKIMQALRKERMDLKLSLWEVGKVLNFDPSMILRYEDGRVTPSLYFVLEYAKFLKVNLKELL